MFNIYYKHNCTLLKFTAPSMKSMNNEWECQYSFYMFKITLVLNYTLFISPRLAHSSGLTFVCEILKKCHANWYVFSICFCFFALAFWIKGRLGFRIVCTRSIIIIGAGGGLYLYRQIEYWIRWIELSMRSRVVRRSKVPAELLL